MFSVILKPAEWDAASSLGAKREALRLARGRGQDFDKTDGGGSMVKRNAIGAVAEYALARHYSLQRLWCETQAFSEEHWKITADVGHGIQVRATDRSTGRLWGYTYDKGDDQAYVLARVDATRRTVSFIGWMYGRDIKSPQYWDLMKWSRPAFTPPVEVLTDMALLPEALIYGPAA